MGDLRFAKHSQVNGHESLIRKETMTEIGYDSGGKMQRGLMEIRGDDVQKWGTWL